MHCLVHMSTNPFAQALSRHLQETGKSQSQFARDAEVIPSRVNRWIREGNVPPADEDFARALRVMGVRFEELYPGEPAPASDAPEAV
jgi:transcriptional regulator with XRE-family HTH domain